MLRIIDLLNQKNHYLEKFYTLNELELLNFSQDDFNNLDVFYNGREKILETILYIDTEISKVEFPSIVENAQLRTQISESFAVKDEYVNRILAQDLEILSCIESKKSNIIRELWEIKKAKKVFNGYKSPTFKNRLNEEL